MYAANTFFDLIKKHPSMKLLLNLPLIAQISD